MWFVKILNFMMIMKRRLSIISFLTILVFLIFPAIVLADIWDSCPYGEVDCAYPGFCGRYVDTNSDGLCDRGQEPPGVINQGETNPSLELTVATSNINPLADQTIDDVAKTTGFNSGGKRIYHLVPLLIIVTMLYALTYILSSMGIIRLVTHRKIWNVVLLVTFLISAVLGLFLILSFDFDIDIPLFFDTLYWHVEIGIAMGVVAMLHILWHWRYFTKLVKQKS